MDESSVPCTKQLNAINSTSNQSCTAIRLFTYDWILHDYRMVIPLRKTAVKSPIFPAGLYCETSLFMRLYTSDGGLYLSIYLLNKPVCEEIKRTYFNEAILNLEFIDSNGKTLKCYKRLPCRFKSVTQNRRHNIYYWKIEESLSMFFDSGSLHTRLKLSLRYFPLPSNNTNISDSRSIELLSNDMKKLLDNESYFPDIVVKVDEHTFLAHKAVVQNQLTEIAKQNSESYFKLGDPILHSTNNSVCFDTIFIPNENAEVFRSVLYYLYSGQFCISDTLDDFLLYEFSKKYKLHELSIALKPAEMHSQSQINKMEHSSTWYVKDPFHKSASNYKLPPFQVGDTAWNVTLFAFDPQTIFLNLQRINNFNRDIQAVFKLKICNVDGTAHDEKEFKHFFKSNKISTSHPTMTDESKFSISPTSLFNDTLIIGCDLIVSDGKSTSENKMTCCSLYGPYFSSIEWINNLQRMLESKTLSEVSLLVDENEFSVHKTILSVRSQVFERMFQSNMSEKFSGCVTIKDISSATIKHIVHYIYTGMIDNISMQYAPEVYYAADKYEIFDLKDRCREFIINNLDVDSVCEVLILSYLHNDEKIREATEYLICTKAAQTLLSSHGLELMTNYPHLVRGLLENLSSLFCSLPPQDEYECKRTKKLKEAAEYVICTKAAQTLLSFHGLKSIKNCPHLVNTILGNLSAVFCSLPSQNARECNLPEIPVLDKNDIFS